MVSHFVPYFSDDVDNLILSASRLDKNAPSGINKRGLRLLDLLFHIFGIEILFD